MRVIANASLLHYLVLIACVHILPELFGRILLPRAVEAELLHPRAPAEIRTWLISSPSCLPRGWTSVPRVTLRISR